MVRNKKVVSSLTQDNSGATLIESGLIIQGPKPRQVKDKEEVHLDG